MAPSPTAIRTESLCVGLQSNGQVLIGGNFTELAYSNHYFIARLNSDGTVDNSFNPGTIAGSAVNAIAVQADGGILIGGTFNEFNAYGLVRNNLARLMSNGIPDLTYGATANAAVQAVYLEPDGESLWGGSFTLLANYNRGRIGRLTTGGALDNGFTDQTGANNTVYAVTEDADGAIYIGGVSHLQRCHHPRRGCGLNSDGTLDGTFNATTNFPTPQVRCLALQSDGKVLVGGSFTAFNSISVHQSRAALRKQLSRPDCQATAKPGRGRGRQCHLQRGRRQPHAGELPVVHERGGDPGGD